jgi:hypothetical protein
MPWGNMGGLISSFIWITYPLNLWLTKQPNSEVPFMVFLYGAFALFFYGFFHRSSSWFIYFFSGILIGYAMLIRPIAIGLGLLMGIIICFAFKDMKIYFRFVIIIILLLGNLTVVFPWEAYVYSKTGKIIPLSAGGLSALSDGLTFAVNTKGYRQEIIVPNEVRRLMSDIQAHRERSSSAKQIFLFFVRALKKRPMVILTLFFIKAARSWYGTGSLRYEELSLAIQVVYLIFILWGMWLTWTRGASLRELVISIWLIVSYFCLLTTLALSIARYMVPAIGLLFVFLPGVFLKYGKYKSKYFTI